MKNKDLVCEHSESQWKWIEHEDPYSGEKYSELELVSKWCFKDISLKQYKCTKCGMVFNY